MNNEALSSQWLVHTASQGWGHWPWKKGCTTASSKIFLYDAWSAQRRKLKTLILVLANNNKPKQISVFGEAHGQQALQQVHSFSQLFSALLSRVSAQPRTTKHVREHANLKDRSQNEQIGTKEKYGIKINRWKKGLKPERKQKLIYINFYRKKSIN